MATPLATAFVRIRPDTSTFKDDVKRDIGRAGRGISNEGKRHGRLFGASFVRGTAGPFRGFAGVVGGPLAGAFAAVAGIQVFKGFIEDARESNRVSRLTAAAIKSTGGAANITAGQVGRLATSISNMTGKDDEAIQAGQNMLLTFTNIRNVQGKNNDIFNQASTILTDMTAALNGGEITQENMRKQAIQLGKALNDPIKGVTALRRVGVSFTEQQTNQIKKLVESGRTLDAQKIILRELGKEFGGAAKASSDPLERLRVIVGNIGENIGNLLLPALVKAADFIGAKVVPAVQGFITWLGPRLKPVITAVARFITGDVVPAIKQFVQFVVTRIVPAVQKWLGIIADALQPALKAIGEVWQRNIRPALQGLFDAVQKNWPAFQRFATIILKVAGFIIRILLPPLLKLAGFLISVIIKNLGLTIAALAKLITWLINTGAAVGRFAVAAARWFVRFYEGARDKVLAVIEFFRKLPGRIMDALLGLGDSLYNRAKDVITRFWDGIKAVWKNVIEWFKDLPSKILSALGIHSPPKWAIDAGRHIMSGILKGIVPGGKDLLQYAKDTVGNLAGIAGGGFLGRLVGAGGGAIRGSAVEIGQRMAASVGWVGAQWRALYDLWNNESGWNPLAQNPNSSAFGIPQFIASTAKQYGVYRDTDPARQIAAGLQYISDRYGDPFHAWAHWLAQSPHSYDRGGWLMPGATLAVNKTGQPERILSPRESAIGRTYNITVNVPPGVNQHEIGRQLVQSIKAYEKGSGAGWRR